MQLSRFNAFIERQAKWKIALVATLIHGVLYLLPNHIHLFPPRELPLSAVDRAVPFWPATVWVYWTDYALVFVGFRYCRPLGTTIRFVYALLTLVLVATAIQWLWPTTYPREVFPIPDGTDPVTAFLFRRFREADSPASCLPSLHVAASYLAAFAVLHHDRRHAALLSLWATAIFVSTLTTKQHYVVDGLAGLALAAAVWWGFASWMRVRVALTETSPSAPSSAAQGPSTGTATAGRGSSGGAASR